MAAERQGDDWAPEVAEWMAETSVCALFAGMETPGVWGVVIRAFAPWSNQFGALKPCGTIAAYQRHMRRNEDACPPCHFAVTPVRGAA